VQAEFGTFDAYIWSFVGGKPKINRWKRMSDVPARTAESDAMSKDLKKRGFRFAGSTICYAFMQAVGMVNDHTVDCYRRDEIRLLTQQGTSSEERTMSDQRTPWDERYDTVDFVYGREPNAFLAEVSEQIPPGDVLCLAEGEGRNAVFLARQGHRVVAVDSSVVGLAKAARLAEESGVRIETVTADLTEFAIDPGRWDAIVSIFCHLPPQLRRALHRKVVEGLRPGGLFILEAYTPAQLALRTGGPPTEEMMMTLAGLREELAGLEFLHGREIERDVVEGRLHTGRGAVVQVVARKP